MTRRGLLVAGLAFLAYWLSNRQFDAYRGDLFYLADAFLHGRTDIAVQLGPWDVILLDGLVYVPFPPFPAIVLMPLVAITGPELADQWESGINAGLAAIDLALAWWVLGRIGVARALDRTWLVGLLGFSTQLWWVTTRGGVWHTGHLVATLITLLLLAELFGRRRMDVIGILVGIAFLTRPPLAFAAPAMALLPLLPDPVGALRAVVAGGGARGRRVRALPWGEWFELGVGLVPALVFFGLYNLDRFGSITESGYALAVLPDFLQAARDGGLFSLAHVPMNLDYLFVHLPMLIDRPPFFRPDGLGLSILLTSPALLLARHAPWREDRRTWLLGLAALLVLIPTLLYYGGGWLQFGYRYALDSIPFVWALCAMAVVRRGLTDGWRVLILFGVIVNAAGVYWAYNL